MNEDPKEKDEPEVDPHGQPRRADDENAQVPQDPTDDHGGGGDPDGSEATGTGPSGGGDPGVPEH
jgi:hypothetical protein